MTQDDSLLRLARYDQDPTTTAVRKPPSKPRKVIECVVDSFRGRMRLVGSAAALATVLGLGAGYAAGELVFFPDGPLGAPVAPAPDRDEQSSEPEPDSTRDPIEPATPATAPNTPTARPGPSKTAKPSDKPSPRTTTPAPSGSPGQPTRPTQSSGPTQPDEPTAPTNPPPDTSPPPNTEPPDTSPPPSNTEPPGSPPASVQPPSPEPVD